jgi:acyl carrier protein phosphodiesterase
MVECPSLSRTILGRSPDWRPVMKQARGCLASAWARLAAKVGEIEASHFLENEWGEKIPEEVIEAGLLREPRFAHLN